MIEELARVVFSHGQFMVEVFSDFIDHLVDGHAFVWHCPVNQLPSEQILPHQNTK